jgi:hypothetical protein
MTREHKTVYKALNLPVCSSKSWNVLVNLTKKCVTLMTLISTSTQNETERTDNHMTNNNLSPRIFLKHKPAVGLELIKSTRLKLTGKQILDFVSIPHVGLLMADILHSGACHVTCDGAED